MGVEVRDGGASEEAEHVDVVVLCGQGEAVLRGQRRRAVYATLTHEECLFDRGVFRVEHLNEAIHGGGHQLVHFGLIIVHQVH